MLKKKSEIFLTLLFLADQCIVWLCWSLAYYSRFSWFDLPAVAIQPPFIAYFKASWIVVVLSAPIFAYAQLYHPKRVFHLKGEQRAILKGSVLLYAALLGASFFYREFSFSRVFSVHFFIYTFFFLSMFRFLVRQFLAYLRKKGRNLRHVLLLGGGKLAQMFESRIANNPELGLVLRGYLAPEANDQLKATYLGDFSGLHLTIAKGIDQVYLALDSDQQSELERLNHLLAEETVDVNIIPDIYHSLAINPEFLDFDGMPIIALRQSPVEGWNRVLKRGFDLLVACCCITVVAPLWLILPLIIKLTSKGPVFYRQTRTGLDGRAFEMLKFRSMRQGAEAQTGAVWAKKGDDRTTPIGAFMRRTSLDEIPQFFNVLRGDMSIIGPRPERPVFIEQFKSQVPNYMLRHKIKTGVTGWAQINGWRGNTSLEKRIEYDIYYLTHWSIWFDMKIFLLSIFKGFKDPNAY